MRDGYQSEIRVYKPPFPNTENPLIVLLYGGGFVTGHCTQLSSHARIAAKLFNAVVLNISHRLSPEHRFPTAPNDVWDNLQWITANEHALGASLTTGFVLGGISSGGNLASVIAQKTVNEGLSPPLTGVWASTPILLDGDIVPVRYKDVWFSRELKATGSLVDKDFVDSCLATYCPDWTSPNFSPFNARNAHTGMPPVYIQVCGLDPLRDDGLIYSMVLKQHKVMTRLDVYPGAPHEHLLFPCKLSTRYHIDIFNGLAWLLRKETPNEKYILQELRTNLVVGV